MTSLLSYIGLGTQSLMVAPLRTGGLLPPLRSLSVATAITAGATSVQLVSDAANTVVRSGSALSFPTLNGRVVLIVAVDVTIGLTPVGVAISPAPESISVSSTAPFAEGFVPVLGLDQFNIQGDPVLKEVHGTDSGTGKFTGLMRTGIVLSCTIHERPRDEGAKAIRKASDAIEPIFSNLYYHFTRPDGEVIRGVGLVVLRGKPGDKDSNAMVNFDVMFQGNTFNILPAATQVNNIAPFFQIGNTSSLNIGNGQTLSLY